ncbi:membrane protein implicated in regulation of membrane protease activity [Haloferula luteola]|uniref:Membrane protein implicated in regulation of membrane protease activity n=1 Tax=Haloferula luteola TaxID=595692 RepID=A0A840V4A3_9BACT|nr:NfeD family protein [Haloferula luteola]MBB5352845.1 membrane protein implicated in regulation of membrane protease activity [Haloferula luteola]
MKPEFLWLLAGVVLILAEFAAPGFIIFFFGVGAILAALTTWLGWTPELGSQSLVFGLSSFALLFGLRRFAKSAFVGRSDVDHADLDDDFTGREARVLRDIPGGSAEGRVEIKGAEWKARSTDPIPAGKGVIIVRREGLTLYVRSL